MDSFILSTPFNFVGSLSSLQILLVCAASPILFLLSLYLYVTPSSLKDSRRRHLPPGPRGLPFIGNLLSLTDEEAIRDIATTWAKKYGDVFYTKIGGSDWIWLSSPRAVKDLMDKKSAIYSSRPPVPLAQDVASAGRRQLFMQYGPRYRTVRKISHNLLNINIATSYQPIHDLESKQLMVELLDNPDQFYDYNRRYSASLIIRIVYGSRIPTWDHPLIPKIYAVLNNMNDISMPGAHIVDTFPSLQYLPEWMVGNWRTYGKKVHAHDAAIYLGLYEDMKKEVAAGTAKPCFCKDFYESDPGTLGIDNLQAAYQVGGLIEAGAETTSASLNNFLLAMTKNPDVVKKAQEELDRVIGPDRLPSFSDEDNLPYIRAIVKENLRMRPPNKVGIAHATTEDDWYEGMFIPKGSQVLINWWYGSPFLSPPQSMTTNPPTTGRSTATPTSIHDLTTSTPTGTSHTTSPLRPISISQTPTIETTCHTARGGAYAPASTSLNAVCS